VPHHVLDVLFFHPRVEQPVAEVRPHLVRRHRDACLFWDSDNMPDSFTALATIRS
jgi:hypothetical protein